MTHLSQWGNSLGVRLPKDLLKTLDMKNGTEVTIYEEKGRIIIAPKSKYTLDSLLETSCPYGEIETGSAQGNEEW